MRPYHNYRIGQYIVYINKEGPAYAEKHNIIIGKPYKALEIRAASVLIQGEHERVAVMFENIRPYGGGKRKSCDFCSSNCKKEKTCELFDKIPEVIK